MAQTVASQWRGYGTTRCSRTGRGAAEAQAVSPHRKKRGKK